MPCWLLLQSQVHLDQIHPLNHRHRRPLDLELFVLFGNFVDDCRILAVIRVGLSAYRIRSEMRMADGQSEEK